MKYGVVFYYVCVIGFTDGLRLCFFLLCRHDFEVYIQLIKQVKGVK